MLNPMVEHSAARLSRTFTALADPTRRAILARLRKGSLRVTDLAAPFDMSLNAVSKHLKSLERARLVQREVRGREHYCSLDAGPLSEASEWMSSYRRYWETRLDALEDLLATRRAARSAAAKKA
jgi:DNA-binding transcriptional ArsR family regulator